MITRNALWINNWRYVPPASEFIEIKMIADDLGKVYVPVGWANGLNKSGHTWANGTYWAAYDWDLYVDWVFTKNVTWSSRAEGYEVAQEGLEPWTFHYIKIYPHFYNEGSWLPNYGWAMAFAMGWTCNGTNNLTNKNPVADYLYEIMYDWAIMGYRRSDHAIGSGYKTCQFAWCINLTKPFEETDISDVIEIGSHFLTGQYAHSWITTTTAEKCPWANDLQWAYREQQYWKCENLTIAADEVDPDNLRFWNSYREAQYWYCTWLRVTAPENPLSTYTWWEEFRFNQYLGCTWIEILSRVEYCPWYGSDYMFRQTQFKDCGNSSNPLTGNFYWSDVIKWVTNSLWLTNDNVYRIFVPSDLVTAYQNDSMWSNIDDNKFIWRN